VVLRQPEHPTPHAKEYVYFVDMNGENAGRGRVAYCTFVAHTFHTLTVKPCKQQTLCFILGSVALTDSPRLEHFATMIRRRGQRPEEEESSSDEEDAFAALSKKAKRQRTESQCSSQKSQSNAASKSEASHKMVLPKSITSSMKRHHKPNDDRKAKMDALLQELEAEKQKVSKELYRFVPDKKGSFVDPSEEHLTTNIFVGNLAPSISE
jgi:hypothetical protein